MSAAANVFMPPSLIVVSTPEISINSDNDDYQNNLVNIFLENLELKSIEENRSTIQRATVAKSNWRRGAVGFLVPMGVRLCLSSIRTPVRSTLNNP